MVTFHCQRVGCRYCDDSDNCHCPDNEVTFNINGKCSGYKNGVWHYITAVVVAMGRNTMIPSMELNTEVKIGIYFLSMLYNITYQYNEHGNWAWISFHEKDENVSNVLDMDTIIHNHKMNPDQYNLFAHYYDYFMNRGMGLRASLYMED